MAEAKDDRRAQEEERRAEEERKQLKRSSQMRVDSVRNFKSMVDQSLGGFYDVYDDKVRNGDQANRIRNALIKVEREARTLADRIHSMGSH